MSQTVLFAKRTTSLLQRATSVLQQSTNPFLFQILELPTELQKTSHRAEWRSSNLVNWPTARFKWWSATLRITHQDKRFGFPTTPWPRKTASKGCAGNILVEKFLSCTEVVTCLWFFTRWCQPTHETGWHFICRTTTMIKEDKKPALQSEKVKIGGRGGSFNLTQCVKCSKWKMVTECEITKT